MEPTTNLDEAVAVLETLPIQEPRSSAGKGWAEINRVKDEAGKACMVKLGNRGRSRGAAAGLSTRGGTIAQ